MARAGLTINGSLLGIHVLQSGIIRHKDIQSDVLSDDEAAPGICYGRWPMIDLPDIILAQATVSSLVSPSVPSDPESKHVHWRARGRKLVL